LTLEIYRHADARSAFGIYSYERPLEGRFLDVDAQGYYEPGSLNFVQGRHYVKLIGFDFGETDESDLVRAAEEVAEMLGGADELPRALRCFPDEGRVAHSERYVATAFLGHRFLHSAFVASYASEGGDYRIFIIKPTDPAEVEVMISEYLALVRRKDGTHEQAGEVYRFVDPYHKGEGTLNLKRVNGHLLGVFRDDPETADGLLGQMEVRLRGATG
jgi:hypothetical protein